MLRRITLNTSRDPVLLIALLLLAACFAYMAQFLQDDGFIIFRYAAHFAEGHGLTWYPGSDEFGYTSFLFTLLVGLLMKAGFAAETASYMISVPAYLGSVAFTFRIARLLTASRLIAVLTCLALITHLTFAAYATGGIETSLQTCMVLAAYYQLFRWRLDQAGRNALIGMGLAAGIAMLVRLDSVILLLPAYGIMIFDILARRRQSLGDTVKVLIPAAGLPVLATLSLLVFCQAYYGQALPNTFYAKIDTHGFFSYGSGFLLNYLVAQLFVPLVIMAWAMEIYSRLSPGDTALASLPLRSRYRLLLSPVVLWLLYLLYIGGDFMEFRLLVPILPFFYLAVLDMILHGGQHVRSRNLLILVFMVLAGNAAHRIHTPDYDADSIARLNKWVRGEPVNWSDGGQALHRLFYTGAPDDVKIAVAPAGAIPFYSGLPAIDQHGLNTRGVLSGGGARFSDRPGHRFIATPEFLQSSGVHLVIGHPSFLLKDGDVMIPHETLKLPEVGATPGELIFLPLKDDYFLLAFYMRKHPAVERAIRQGIILTSKQVRIKER
jgi:arabinofuranosyltransferase